MTREERAREVLGQHMLAKPWGDAGYDATFWRTARVTFDEAIAAMIDFAAERADAEAAAMRERAAGVADAHVAMGYMSGRERDYCHGHGDEIAELIRALTTTEVGNG